MNQSNDGDPLGEHFVDQAVSAEEQLANPFLPQLRDNTAPL